MNTDPLILAPENYAPALDVIGVKVTVLAENDPAHGYGITLQRGEEGAGPPPHSHAWEESFFVLEGKVECQVGDPIAIGLPGTLVHVPAGTLHAFRFGAGGGRMLEITGPGSRAAQMFASVAKQVSPGTPDVPRVVGILREHGVNVAI